MSYLLNLIIFISVLVFYLHTYNHTITNNDREVLRLDDPSAETITELCGTKQPFLFLLQY